jgi:hypothetical protein
MTRSLSLQKLLGQDQFNAGIGDMSWQFTLDPSHFYSRSLIRLRGLAAQVQSNQTGGNWNVVITPPSPSGKIFRPGDVVPHEFDQSHIGDLHLGLVTERVYAVIPEGHAPLRLFNGSPLGKWVIRLFDHTSDARSTDVKDVDIHFKVAVCETLPLATVL